MGWIPVQLNEEQMEMLQRLADRWQTSVNIAVQIIVDGFLEEASEETIVPMKQEEVG